MPEKKKAKKSKDSEEVCEIFEVEKGGKDKIVKTCGEDIKEHASKEEIKNQNKLLRDILIGLGLIVLFFIFILFWIDSVRHFELRGVEWGIVKEGELILYKTAIPVYYQGNIVDYNFYLRNDPRKLDDGVKFEGNLWLLKNMVINGSDFKCYGDEVIALANLIKLEEVLGTNVIKDPNATCDEEGRYAYLNIHEGDETWVKETDKACYQLKFKNCEILEVTEKFMVETFVRFNAMSSSS